MRYSLMCEKCKRPAQIEKQSTDLLEGILVTKKVYEKECPCGGKIKPMHD